MQCGPFISMFSALHSKPEQFLSHLKGINENNKRNNKKDAMWTSKEQHRTENVLRNWSFSSPGSAM